MTSSWLNFATLAFPYSIARSKITGDPAGGREPKCLACDVTANLRGAQNLPAFGVGAEVRQRIAAICRLR